MSAQDLLRQAIDDEQRRLREGVPPDRQAALLALIHYLGRPQLSGHPNEADIITGQNPHALGGKRALCLCLEPGAGITPPSPPVLESWAEEFRRDCAQVVRAETVLMEVESGDLTLVVDDSGALHSWPTSKRPPPPLRERRDIDWWAGWLARERENRRPRATYPALQSSKPAEDDHGARHDAQSRVAAMDGQFPYPPDAMIGGASVQTHLDVLRWLIRRATMAVDAGVGSVWRSRAGLVEGLSTELGLAPPVAALALDGFTLRPDNARYHAGVTGGGSAPVIGLDQDCLALSLHGLTSEPLFFLARELRRRDAQAYNNTAFVREERFRADLYALFPDKRFVTSAGRIRVRREQGDLRTDIDAAIFDRKTGALGIFELKSHDPFARTSAELARQRDNVLYANRQVSGVLDWLKRHGADDLLSRIDQPTAKRYHVSKVFPFVLGRYLVRFNNGPEPDRRAAWATWPQVLRAVAEQPPLASTNSPLATLHARLGKDDPVAAVMAGSAAQDVPLGMRRLIVHPSYAAYRASLS